MGERMPNTKETSGSMFTTVEEHGKTLDVHSRTLEEHAKEISVLKQSDAEIMQELKSMKTDFTNLENTIWKTAQSTQDVMKTTTDRLWELLGVRDAQQHEITHTKLTSFWEWLGKATVGGGIFIVALELLFGK